MEENSFAIVPYIKRRIYRSPEGEDAVLESNVYHMKEICFFCSKDFIEINNKVTLNCRCIVCFGCLLKERMLNKSCLKCGGVTNRAIYKGQLIDWSIHNDPRFLRPGRGKTESAHSFRPVRGKTESP